MSDTCTCDPHWERTYSSGHILRAPWDVAVAFLFRNRPAGVPHEQVRVLELGFGTGTNLFFAAAEGFRVHGLEGSPAAVATAQARFAKNGLEGDLRVGDFTQPLPFDSCSMDLVIDRAALTCVGIDDARRAIGEARRVLKPGGRMLFNCYSDRNSSMVAGLRHANGLVTDITCGGYEGFGQLSFWSRREVLDSFAEGWEILSLDHVEIIKMLAPQMTIASEWRVIAQRSPAPQASENPSR